MPTLTLLAAAAAAALSVVDIATENVSNEPTQVAVSPPDDDRAEQDDAHAANDVTIETRPQYSPYVPPIGRSDRWADECVNAHVTRGRPVAC